MRELAFDTETTGTEVRDGDRLVEIGCVELVDRNVTGREYHTYLNPERDISADAVKVHGLTNARLAQERRFAEVADELLEFLGDDPLVIHNAEFDLGFLNAELARVKRPKLPADRAIDSLVLARRKYPGQSNSLDALCERFNIDISRRHTHGALLDAQLLAQVYIDLTDSRHESLLDMVAGGDMEIGPAQQRTEPLPPRITPEQMQLHREKMIELLGADAIWRQYDRLYT